MARVLDSGWFILGPEGEAFERELAACARRAARGGGGQRHGGDPARAAKRSASGAGDEVITSPLTAAFTALAILRAGARPVFADVDPVTLNVAPEAVAARDHAADRARSCPSTSTAIPSTSIRCWRSRASAASRSSRTPARPRRASTRGGRWARSAGHRRALLLSHQEPRRARRRRRGPGATTRRSRARLRRLRNGGQSDRYRHEIAGINSRLDEMQAAHPARRPARTSTAWTERRRALAALLRRAGSRAPASSLPARAALRARGRTISTWCAIRGATRSPPALKRARRSARSSTTRSRCTCSRRSQARRPRRRLPGRGAGRARDPVPPALPRDDRRGG